MASTFELLALAQLNFLYYPPTAVVYQTATQSIANGSLVPITMDTSSVDNYAGHSNVTNPSRYTAQVAGRYWVRGVVGWAANSNGNRITQIAVNGTGVPQGQQQVLTANNNNNDMTEAGQSVFLNVGDYVEVWGYQASGGALSTQTLLSSMQLWWTGAV